MTLDGLRDIVRPVGEPEPDRTTVPEKPERLERVIVAVPVLPA